MTCGRSPYSCMTDQNRPLVTRPSQNSYANMTIVGSSSSSITRNRQPSHAGRRRSTVLMNLQLNDPSIPSPGEMVNESQVSGYRTSSPHSLTGSPIMATGDPHHFRAPSLGEIHQEIEQEQEAQVVCRPSEGLNARSYRSKKGPCLDSSEHQRWKLCMDLKCRPKLTDI